VDPEELIGPSEVAEILGLSNPRGVSVYTSRYDDFPAPTVSKGNCRLWLRPEIVQWASQRRGTNIS
jgi:predicted DNA-binding transcriptional regulator AlpA